MSFLVTRSSKLGSWPPTPSPQLLKAYFCSGWAFLIPYLSAYLLYAWLKWPVNPAAGGEGLVNAISEGVHSLSPSSPPLLHVYWLFHALHLVLGAIALRALWWRSGATVIGATPNARIAIDHAALSQAPTATLTGNRSLDTVYRLLPWVFLGVLFYIPGVYMEFPADPWAHYARVNEWASLGAVTQHSAWAKSSYFLAYSFIGRIAPPLLQLKWFDVYYTGCCLLLCWQYYRLARAVGLGERASCIFVLIQALTLGNNVFDFYRYYGMSSTLFAQLGAVALIRAALESLRPKDGEIPSRKPEFGSQPAVLRSLFSVLWRPLGAILLLLALTAFNHVQGLGIAGLGIAAVIVWRLIEWRRTMIGWLALAAVVLNVVIVMWWPRQAAIDEIYRSQGWLTAWYGFNLFAPGSPSFNRAAAVIGLFGLGNIIAGLILLRRNDVAAWLTLFPALLLILPFFTIPLVNALVKNGQDDGLVIYHRLLLTIPAGLATVALANALIGNWKQKIASLQRFTDSSTFMKPKTQRTRYAVSLVLLLCGIGTLVTIPASDLYYNRFYNALTNPPNDLAMHGTLDTLAALRIVDESRDLTRHKFTMSPVQTPVMAPRGMGYILSATGRHQVIETSRLIGSEPWNVPATRSDHLLWLAGTSFANRSEVILVQPRPLEMFTPFSFAGYLSQHWRPQEVALEYTAALELSSVGSKAQTNSTGILILLWTPAVSVPASTR